MTLPSHISLFEMTKQATNHHLSTIQCSKLTLIHLSHTLEDIILKNNIPALMFTGFQESSHWMKETERYEALAQIAKQVCIFAGKPLPADSASQALQVELTVDDPLRQEWFVIILSETYNVLLTGRDNLTMSTYIPEAWRTFETILSFDPLVIDAVLDHLEQVIENYRPDLLEQLQKTRQETAPITNDPQYLESIINEYLTFGERINQKLRYESTVNHQIFATMKAFSLVLDETGIITSANPALKYLLHTPIDDIIGQNFLTLLMPEDSRPIAATIIKTVQETGQGRRFASILATEDDVRHIDWDVSLIYLAGERESIFVMGHDVTERVLLAEAQVEEARIRTMLEQEREISKLRSQFITTVSHEFRTPLTSILNSAEMLQRHSDKLGEDGRNRRLIGIKKQVLALNSMVEEISIAMAATEGNLTFSPTNCYINEMTSDILAGITSSLSTGNRIIFTKKISDDYLIADTRLFRFILINLVTNALKYSPDDTLVTVELQRQGQRLILSVSDQGSGIPEEEQKYIFDSFYRGSNIGNEGGTGMGLRIVQDCLAIYDGTIALDSSENGSTFTVKLPIPQTIP